MTWLKSLDDLVLADRRAVGHKAYCLGLLKQSGLPIAQAWVLTADAWHHSLGQLSWSKAEGDRLAPVTQGGFQRLQQVSQQWQQALRDIPAIAPAAWSENLSENLAANPCLPAVWMLRASLWIDRPGADALAPSPEAEVEGLLPALIGADVEALPQVLPQFWSQALAARCLVVWGLYCQRLQEVNLATLIMPVYPALASGTLTLGQGQVTVAAVAGLGLALTRGEAIPARCRVPLGEWAKATWEPGFQEQVYQLRAASADPLPQQTGTQPVQGVGRDRPELSAPLNDDQLAQLVQIAETAQAVLGSAGVRLEWLLYPRADLNQPALVITQASAWHASTVPTSPPAVSYAPARLPIQPLLPPPLLPSASIAVRGIGAAAGRLQGVAVVAKRPQDLPRPLPPGCIVVLPDLQPDVFLQLQAVAGIVTEQGGATCHAAILAREVGIPAVVGAPQATQLLENGMAVWLDGDRGVVYGFTDQTLAKQQFQTAFTQFQPTLVETTPSPPLTEHKDRYQQLTTRVMVNLSQLRGLDTLPLEHIAGIGLLRSEWLLLDLLEGRHPWDWVNRGQEIELQGQIVQQLEPILQALGPKPLRYRSLDLRSHEWQALQGSPPVESNPMLGLRGTLSYNIDSRLFQVELAALATLQRAGYTNMQLILPFVRTVEEVIACRQLIQQAGLTDCDDFALWIMAEVPSVLFLLPAYARAGVQGIAIGSNDLTQLLLAVDRDQPIIASAYDEQHPVVRLAMAHLVQEARRCGLLCSICGQAPVRHPELIADLVAWGISSISVESAALPFTLEAVWQAEQRVRGEG